ncbi:MAG: DedA family protein [Candidatus Kaiserbacteria bacterium]|nr:MAG: DedA family protein [Candidatus Kaiserbacteria bacterium]
MEGGLLIQLLIQYKYAIMAPASVVFGPTASLFAGVLVRLGVLELLPTALILAAGELVADIVWYWLGKRYGDSFVQRWGHFFGITPALIGRVKALFANYHDAIIFTSKITAGMGFSIAIFLTAGMVRVPFWRYMLVNVIGQFFWTAGLLSIGYFLGHVYLSLGSLFEKAALVAVLAIIVLAMFGFARYVRGQFTQ